MMFVLPTKWIESFRNNCNYYSTNHQPEDLLAESNTKMHATHRCRKQIGSVEATLYCAKHGEIHVFLVSDFAACI